MQDIVVLGASHAEVPIVSAIKELGYRSIVLSGDPKGLAIGVADEFVERDYSDIEAVSEVVAVKRPSAVVAGCNDFAAITASAIAEEFGLPGYDSLTTTRAVHLKSEFRALCDTLALSSPRAQAFDGPVDAMRYCEGVLLPAMVKPVDLTGGKGIGLIREAAEIEPLVTAAFRASREKVVVVEEFIPGTLHSCCVLIRDQQVIFDFFADELMLENPYLVASAMSPSVVKESARRALIREIELLANHLTLVDGLVHVQFILQSDRPRIIEICRRPPGDLYVEFVRLSTSFDLARAIVSSALGLPSDSRRGEERPVLRQCVMADQSGRVEAVNFDDVLERHVVSRTPLRVLPTTIENHLTEKTEIFFAAFDSVDAMRSIAGDIRRHVQITIT